MRYLSKKKALFNLKNLNNSVWVTRYLNLSKHIHLCTSLIYFCNLPLTFWWMSLTSIIRTVTSKDKNVKCIFYNSVVFLWCLLHQYWDLWIEMIFSPYIKIIWYQFNLALNYVLSFINCEFCLIDLICVSAAEMGQRFWKHVLQSMFHAAESKPWQDIKQEVISRVFWLNQCERLCPTSVINYGCLPFPPDHWVILIAPQNQEKSAAHLV